ncbi:hypothetical protein AOC36_03815 [Erysipelothrix larvae]|uniref:Uncharacterized protein n=1 Tax=Erysipelothrix larvae TaxID=1514105 RepID=A0A0X8GZ63_9FIRM|nr:hypothetical protein AOC36_03815 [Erysipelothrix larvae]
MLFDVPNKKTIYLAFYIKGQRALLQSSDRYCNNKTPGKEIKVTQLPEFELTFQKNTNSINYDEKGSMRIYFTYLT